MKVLALQQLRNRELRQQPHKIVRGKRAHPAAVEIDDGLLRIKNLEDLRLIGLRILVDLLSAQRRPGSRASARITDHSREIANQKNRRVPEILKMFELAQDDRVSQVQVGSGRVHAQLHA